jgi:hypothetical protein
MSNDNRLLLHLTLSIAILGIDGYVLAPWLWDLAAGSAEPATLGLWSLRAVAAAGTVWVAAHLTLDGQWQPVRAGGSGLLVTLANVVHGREDRETLRDAFGEIVLLLMLIAVLLGIGGHLLA